MSKPEGGRIRRAAALRYEGDGAPRVVATGAGEIAERIIKNAIEAGVPVRDDAALAEALARVEINQEIPSELYQAVAQALVWAHGLDLATRIAARQAAELPRRSTG
ncbi:MAG: EscU/YscU/HrcU family type III secretion system export apparatus switch protein [Solirubrobacteraceae bacterium]|nr:EscU/YscU/HrcU family type III secretion system export apparatus switch protein [Solirubrobacteraceae bacterium]